MLKLPAVLALIAASALVLTGCTSDSGPEGKRVHVVATTNVYGSLAEQVGGERVEVSSLIDSAAQDPHEFEATARDRLAVQRADLVVENGGGYDPYMAALTDGTEARVITAFALAKTGGDNEHVWFDVPTVDAVVKRIAADLGAIDPAGAEEYRANAEKVSAQLKPLTQQIDALRAADAGGHVFITEPLPGLLAAAIGLKDVTPEGFASAVEEGDDVPPAVLLAGLDAIANGDVRAVLTTVQTGGSETQRVTEAAKQAGIPVVEFSELLEPPQNYAQWMTGNIDRLAKALEQ